MAKSTLLNHGKLGMGTWYLGDRAATRQEEIAALRYGLEHGVSIIDTAEMYGNGRSENLVGEAIQPFARQHLPDFQSVAEQCQPPQFGAQLGCFVAPITNRLFGYVSLPLAWRYAFGRNG